MGYAIFRHAVIMVFANFGNALRVSLVPLLVMIGAGLVVFLATGLNLEDLARLQETLDTADLDAEATGSDTPVAPGMIGMAVGAILVLIVLYAAIAAWIAVAWHRFILLEEYPGPVPSLHGGPVLAYIGKSILIGLVVLVVFIPAAIVLGVVLLPVAAGSPVLGGLLIGLLIGTLVAYVGLRISLILPAASIGESMGIGASWRATGRLSGPVFVAVICLTLLNIVLALPIELILGGTAAGLLAQQVVNWITLMIGLSALTTLYGHLVQGRDLA